MEEINKKHYLYFLWSEKLKKVYIGETKNILKRLAYHNASLQRYTKSGVPWILVGYVGFASRSEALSEERMLKKNRNRNFYKQYLLKHGKKIRN